MKRLSILFLLALAWGMTLQAADFETATQTVKNMGLGWNLGNALDANSQQYHDPTQANYWGQQDVTSETCWGQFVTKPELLKMMKEAGFGAIRVPTTWYNHMDQDGNVHAAWMQRVHDVVDYVINQGMYCILNVHHDTGADSNDGSWRSWIKADASNYSANKARYEHLWQQIAQEFRNYDQHLLFEGYNEMLDAQSSWNFAKSTTAYTAINNYAQSFVNVVRATGGNNAQRNLIVSTYGACSGSGNWSDKLQDPLKYMTIPEGESNHIIFEVHNYPSLVDNNKQNRTINDIKKEIDAWITNLKTYLVSKGAPVIIGEWGTSNVDAGDGKTDYDVRKQLMFQFVEYLIKAMKQNDIATFYWMGLTDGIARTYPAFTQPDLALKMLQSYHGSSYSPYLPDADDVKVEKYSCTVNYTSQYGEYALFNGSINGNDYQHLHLQLADAPANGSLQFKVYYSTSEKHQAITAKDTNLSLSGLSNITRITLQWLKPPTGSVKIDNVYLVRNDNAQVYSNPGVFWGCYATDIDYITGIHDIQTDCRAGDGRMYNLNGQQMTTPHRGIYILNGRKYVK